MSCRAGDVGDGLRQREVAPQHETLVFENNELCDRDRPACTRSKREYPIKQSKLAWGPICRAITKLGKILGLFSTSNLEDIAIPLLI